MNGTASGGTPARPSSENLTSALPASAQEPAPAPRRPRKRLVMGAVAAVAVAGAAFAASGAELPLIGDDKDGGTKASSDIPEDYVGTWSGEVQRDGEPTGQYRRFVISRGKVGEVVANSVSLGITYECKSDGKLVSAGKSLELDTKVVKSVPEGKCSALGSHNITRGTDSTLKWEAAGRNATLHKVTQPEKLPDAYLGTWQRALPGGGTQRITVEQVEPGKRSISMVSEAPDQHCEAKADIFSTGGDGEEDVRIGPPALDKTASTGECATGQTATLRAADGGLVRTFATTGQEFEYTRVE